MRIDLDTPIAELIHCNNTIYIDLDADVIVHWKYVKREKLANGKYRYYYDESDIKKLEEEYSNLSSATVNKAAITSKQYQRLSKMKPTDRHYAKTKEAFETNKKTLESMLSRSDALSKKLQKKKMSTFAERTISKGAVAVANFFSNVFSKTKK